MFELDCRSTIEPMNAGLFVSPGYGTHDTRILDTYELIFVTSGRLGLFEGETEYVLKKNQTLILYPAKRHGGLFPYPAELNFYWVHFRMKETSGSDTPLRVPKVTTVSDPEYLTELFCQFISDQEAVLSDPSASGSAFSLGFAQLVTLMLCEVSAAAAGSAGSRKNREATDRQRAIAQDVQNYIEANYHEQIGTLEIARDLEYSTDYIERAFRHVKHQSITDAVHENRIDEARALLRQEGRKNISEIAFACGFRDPGYFRRVFKRLTGLTARQFRSLYSRTHINAH